MKKALLNFVRLLPVISLTAHAVDFDAVLNWTEIYVVGFPLDGSVAQVHVRPGQRVSEGKTLIELDSEPITIRIKQFQAEVAADQTVLADAKREYEQAQSLYEQTVLADDELQRKLHAYERARAELTISNARLDYARWQLKKARVKAPWDAWVVQRFADPGQVVVAEQRSRPLLVLAKSGVMGAMADVPATHIDTIRIGQHATVLVDDKSFSAKVSTIAMQQAASEQDGHYRVQVVFDVASGEVFRAGQAATIRLP